MVRVNTSTAAQERHLDSLEALRERVEAVGLERDRLTTEVAERLYRLGGEAPREERFTIILPCRRAVLEDRELPPESARPAGGRDQLAAWADARAEYQKLRTELLEADEAVLAHERERLRSTLGGRDLLAAAAMTSTALAHGAVRYARTPLEGHHKKIRKTEGKLLRYARRAVHKTSPFSHYTVSGIAFWQSAGRVDAWPGPAPDIAERRTRVTPNLLPALLLVDGVAGHVDGVAHIPLRLVDRMSRTESGYLVTASRQPQGPTNLYRPHRSEIQVKRSRALDAVVDLLATGPLTGEQVWRALADRGLDAERQSVLALLARLVRLGVLIADLGLDQQAGQPLAHFADRLRSARGELPEQVADRLDDLDRRTRMLVDTWGEQRAVAMEALEQSWQESFRVAGTPAPPSNRCYEDVVLARPVTLVDRAWRRVLDDLADVLVLLEPFNVQHASQSVLRGAFRARFGARGSAGWQEYVELLRETFSGTEPTYAGMVGRIPGDDLQVRGLVAARAQVMDRVAALLAQHADAAEVVLDRGALAGEAAAAADGRRTASVSAFLQVTHRDAAGAVSRAVVNSLLDGNAMFLSRFLDLIEDGAAEVVRAHLGESLPRGATELRPVQGFNANRHPRLLPAEFLDDSHRPAGAADVDPRSCRVVDDPATGRLRLVDARGEVRLPVYSGLLIPYLLPWSVTALYMLSDAGQLRFDPVGELDRRRPGEGVRHYPAVRYGSLVLSRERWYLDAVDFPVRGEVESGGQFALRVHRWRHAHGVPAQVYIAALPAPPAPGAPAATVELERPKPIPVRLDSPLDCLHVNRWLEGGARYRIERADPPLHGVEDPIFGRHVTEYVLELCREG